MNALSDPLHQPDAADILARTIWGEARGETRAGQEAIAQVVLNRIAYAKSKGGRYWWGSSVVSVCLKPWQFSCWNASDPNRAKLESVTDADETFVQCLQVARQAVEGRLDDMLDGATHYHAEGLSPPWAKGRQPVARVGRHVFYKDIG